MARRRKLVKLQQYPMITKNRREIRDRIPQMVGFLTAPANDLTQEQLTEINTARITRRFWDVSFEPFGVISKQQPLSQPIKAMMVSENMVMVGPFYEEHAATLLLWHRRALMARSMGVTVLIPILRYEVKAESPMETKCAYVQLPKAGGTRIAEFDRESWATDQCLPLLIRLVTLLVFQVSFCAPVVGDVTMDNLIVSFDLNNMSGKYEQTVFCTKMGSIRGQYPDVTNFHDADYEKITFWDLVLDGGVRKQDESLIKVLDYAIGIRHSEIYDALSTKFNHLQLKSSSEEPEIAFTHKSISLGQQAMYFACMKLLPDIEVA